MENNAQISYHYYNIATIKKYNELRDDLTKILGKNPTCKIIYGFCSDKSPDAYVKLISDKFIFRAAHLLIMLAQTCSMTEITKNDDGQVEITFIFKDMILSEGKNG